MMYRRGGYVLAKLKKIPKQYRLDFETVAFLEAISSKKEVTETQVIEIAISALATLELSLEEREDILVRKFRETLELGKETD